MSSFKYLGRILTDMDENCPEVVENLYKDRKSWARLSRILGREGASLGVSRMSFKALIQAVIVFG